MEGDMITRLLEGTMDQVADLSKADLEAVLPSIPRDLVEVAQDGNHF